jgi:hypothetical protein
MLRPIICAVAAVLALSVAVGAEDIATIPVSLQDHRFLPEEIRVPAGKPVYLEIANHDATAEEFDSGILAIEKIIPANGHARIRLRPLAPGRYPFVGEFHADTAHGAIVSLAPP